VLLYRPCSVAIFLLSRYILGASRLRCCRGFGFRELLYVLNTLLWWFCQAQQYLVWCYGKYAIFRDTKGLFFLNMVHFYRKMS